MTQHERKETAADRSRPGDEPSEGWVDVSGRHIPEPLAPEEYREAMLSTVQEER